MRYGLKIEKQADGSVFVTCRDVPECAYRAETEAKAVEMAGEMLPGAMVIFYRKKRRAIPMPTTCQEGELEAIVPVRIQAKILLWNYMVENRYRVTDLAKKLNVQPIRAQSLVDMTKDGASMEAIENGLEALGMSFTLSITKK